MADITYVPTWTGFVYLAIVLDVFSRKVVAWAMAHHLRTELMLAALNMAIGQRCPKEVIHHSDKGSQYTSLAFGKRCRQMGVLTSTGSAGDCFDNAMAESFFATLECELNRRRAFQTQAEARMTVFQFIDGWYNTRRRHSALGYLSPNDFERAATAARPESDGGPGRRDWPWGLPVPRVGRPRPPSGATRSLNVGEGFTSSSYRAPQCCCRQPSTVHGNGLTPVPHFFPFRIVSTSILSLIHSRASTLAREISPGIILSSNSAIRR